MNYGNKNIIHGFSYSFSNGFYAIVGNNGSGKSTLLKSVLNEIPFLGHIQVHGVCSYLPQSNSISISTKVLDLVVMGRYRFKKFFESYKKHDFVLAEEMLEKLKILHLANFDFTTLSGGEQQMVLFAQMLLNNANILILDEPTLHLDIKNKHLLFSVLSNEINNGKIILCVTHDIDMLKNMSGKILYVKDRLIHEYELTKESIELVKKNLIS